MNCYFILCWLISPAASEWCVSIPADLLPLFFVVVVVLAILSPSRWCVALLSTPFFLSATVFAWTTSEEKTRQLPLWVTRMLMPTRPPPPAPFFSVEYWRPRFKCFRLIDEERICEGLEHLKLAGLWCSSASSAADCQLHHITVMIKAPHRLANKTWQCTSAMMILRAPYYTNILDSSDELLDRKEHPTTSSSPDNSMFSPLLASSC